MQMMATTIIYKMVNRNLMTMDATPKWIPQLVKSIPSLANKGARIYTENGVKKISANWEILPNAVWGDGTPITGYDVKFAWTVARTPTVSVGEREQYDQIEDIKVDEKNPKKFTFIYKQAKWDFARLGTFYVLPKHLEEEIFNKYSKENEGYAKNSQYTRNPTNPGLYNGPYRVEEIKLGSHLSLIPNEKFYGKKPNIKKIILKLIPNTGTLEANMLSGTIDMVSELGFTFDQALAFDKKIKAEHLPFKINFKEGLTYEHIDLNQENPILKDVRVRKALVYAINRDNLVKALFEGKQKKALHMISPMDPWYTDDPKKITLYPTDKAKAGQLLDEAGWKMGPDGIRVKDGQKLSLPFMTTAGNKTRELVQVYLQKEWKSVGIDIQIKNEPARVFFNETTKKGKYGGMAMYAWISSPENTPRAQLHTANIPNAANGWSGQNYPRWTNPEVDKIIEEIDVTFDPKKRKNLVAKVLKAYTDEVPVIPLYYRAEVSATPVNQSGYQLTGHQFSSSNTIENWNLQ